MDMNELAWRTIAERERRESREIGEIEKQRRVIVSITLPLTTQ